MIIVTFCHMVYTGTVLGVTECPHFNTDILLSTFQELFLCSVHIPGCNSSSIISQSLRGIAQFLL